MPEAIRRTAESLGALPPRSGFCAAAASVPACLIVFESALAQEIPPADGAALAAYLSALMLLDRHEVAALALTLGILAFAVTTAILLVRTRGRLAQTSAAKHQEAVAARAAIDRAYALLLSDPQILITWPAASEQPEILGDPAIIAGEASVLAFDEWLAAETARELERCLDALRARGVSFAMTLTTRANALIEAEGQVVGGCAILRLRAVSGIKYQLTELTQRYRKQLAESAALRALVEAVPAPVWYRDDTGELAFVNEAYVRAVEAKDAGDAVERGIELFDQAARAELSHAQEADTAWRGRLPAVMAGQRRSLDVITAPAPHGSVGIAIDASEAEIMRAELRRMHDAQRRILDQLATGVAMFGSDQRLTFYNAAYRALWDLDADFLDQQPMDAAVLDRLRAARKLPDEQDFRHWKGVLHEAYRAVEAKEHTWHLPDGRTIRVVTTPNPEGGVIYLFDDVTERLDLERRFDALIRVQRETLDNLVEAVAVFGSDGKLRLFNPVFATLWQLDLPFLDQHPHIKTVSSASERLHAEHPVWQRMRATVTAIDNREPVIGRIERADGNVVDCATTPLPDGATLVTFQDVTDTVNVERALRERNEALEAADKLKIDFVHHVSYELRSPLTNIIGFAHFLGDPLMGPLTDKQREYLGYITVSTNALLAIINNILDLATIDAGAMVLNLGRVDIRKTMEAAAEGVQDRLVRSGIRLEIRSAPNIGAFVADERRVRQCLFNLLANAVGFSPAGESIVFSAQRLNDAIVFSVTDRGPGIPPDVRDKVFDWFETHSLGSRHRGTGLGLSLVRSFVELHGGSVSLESAMGRGTTVTCVFPLGHSAEQAAA
jgi:signal transduction histidine kinase